MTVREIIENAEHKMAEAGIEESYYDSRALWEYATGQDRIAMLLNMNEQVDDGIYSRYMNFVHRRCDRTPLQYITGTQNFMGLDFLTAPGVLIPRYDTETVVSSAIDIIKKKKYTSVLDMCCGSGCIGLTIGHECNLNRLVLGDISGQAVSLTEKNADRLDIVCNIVETDMFSGIDGRFDLIISNPPYIRSDVIPTLMPEVRDHEPKLALDGSADGLVFYRRISADAADYLNAGGYLVYEIGNDQGDEVSAIMRGNGFSDVTVLKDLNNNDRAVTGHL